LLIVDEAQGLAPAALEELRMLSNVTEGGRAPMQTILLGQPQLRRTLASPDLDQLRQRVLACYHLGALSREETHAYVEHRMRAVGWEGDPKWEPDALDLVYKHTSGIPRRINRLCSRVLLSGALEQSHALSGQLVDATAIELEDDLSSGMSSSDPEYRMSDGETDSVLQDVQDRVEALERLVARRERIFNRMAELFSDGGRTRG
jgi:hypothetical protein